jgi:hypothetical protein
LVNKSIKVFYWYPVANSKELIGLAKAEENEKKLTRRRDTERGKVVIAELSHVFLSAVEAEFPKKDV